MLSLNSTAPDDKVDKSFLFRIVTWIYSCLQSIDVIITYLKQHNYKQIICIFIIKGCLGGHMA